MQSQVIRISHPLPCIAPQEDRLECLFLVLELCRECVVIDFSLEARLGQIFKKVSLIAKHLLGALAYLRIFAGGNRFYRDKHV
jgi:hypothetical protein